jgi:hypothetical protein
MIRLFRKRRVHSEVIDISTYSMYEDVIDEYRWLHRQWRQVAERAVAILESEPTCFCAETMPVSGGLCSTCELLEDFERLQRYDK